MGKRSLGSHQAKTDYENLYSRHSHTVVLLPGRENIIGISDRSGLGLQAPYIPRL